MSRLWVRVKIMRKFELDDFLILASDICAWISVGFAVAAVNSGSGRHIQTLTTGEIEGAILYTFAGLISGILSFCLPKLAIVKLLSTLLNPSRRHLIWLWSISIFNLLILLSALGLVFGRCYPSNSQWDFSVPAEYCWDIWYTVDYTRGVSAFSAFVDLYLSVYPAAVLYKIRLPLKKKIALSAALGIGSISTIVAVYKITTLSSLASADFTYDSYDLVIFTLAEGSVITIAACLPLLQPLLEVARQHPWSRLRTNQSTHPTSDSRKDYMSTEQSDDRSRIQKMRDNFEMNSILATRNDDNEAVVIPELAATQNQTLRVNEDETALRTIDAESQKSSYNAPSKTQQGIYRTDDIYVSYGGDVAGTAKSRYHQSDWA
ncbi:hypothetical protein ONZ43_g7024 [Nemania bipapillata]|uniref:Uncharacterized protein n=1 Tax=Nemania bipapillata TaxID=110536 RepID=A0ACC2HU28_9PEZI|nr:hypothetical protein ONZ43_g7024 [Nemania bipapillata]